MLLEYFIVFLIIIITTKIILVMMGFDVFATNSVASGIILVGFVLFLIIFICSFIYGIFTYYKKPAKRPKDPEYVTFIEHLNIYRFYPSEGVELLTATIDMVEESTDGSPINQRVGGYHEVFNIKISKEIPKDIMSIELFSWTSDNGTIINFNKSNDGSVSTSLKKPDNIKITGFMKTKYPKKFGR